MGIKALEVTEKQRRKVADLGLGRTGWGGLRQKETKIETQMWIFSRISRKILPNRSCGQINTGSFTMRS